MADDWWMNNELFVQLQFLHSHKSSTWVTFHLIYSYVNAFACDKPPQINNMKGILPSVTSDMSELISMFQNHSRLRNAGQVKFCFHFRVAIKPYMERTLPTYRVLSEFNAIYCLDVDIENGTGRKHVKTRKKKRAVKHKNGRVVILL